MRIRFLRDFRGRATDEVFYPAGAEVEHPNWAQICAEGAAAIVDEPGPVAVAEVLDAMTDPEAETVTPARRPRRVVRDGSN